METALIAMFIILAIESIALTFLYVKFHQEKRITSLRIERNNENLVERSNYYIKQKIEEALSNRKEESKSTLMVELKGLKELTTQDLLTRIKSIEKYLDVSYCSESDGCIVNWFHKPNENNSGGYIKNFYLINRDDIELPKTLKYNFKAVKGVKNEQKESVLKSDGCLNNELYELNKEIDKIESRLKILVAHNAIKDMDNLLKK